MAQRTLGIFGGLDPPMQPMPSPWPHSCTSSVLCHIRSKNKDICPKKVLSYLCMTHSPAASCSFSQCALTNNLWLASEQSGSWYLTHAHQPLYLLGFHCVSRGKLTPFSVRYKFKNKLCHWILLHFEWDALPLFKHCLFVCLVFLLPLTVFLDYLWRL